MSRPIRLLPPAAVCFIIACLWLIGRPLPVPAADGSVYLILRQPQAEHVVSILDGARQLAREKHLELKILATPGAEDGPGQAAFIGQALAQGCRAMIVDPADEEVLPALVKAQKAGAALVILGRTLSRDDFQKAGLDPHRVVTDQDKAVAMVVGYMQQEVGRSGEVLIIGSSSRGPSPDRIARAVETRTGLTIRAALSVNGRPQAAYRLIADRYYEQHPAEAILCAEDKAIPSILKALRSDGLSSKTILTGYGNLEVVRPLLKSGRLAATIDPRWDLVGRTSLATLLKIKAGENPPRVQSVTPELILARFYGRRVTAVFPQGSGRDGHDLVRGVRTAARRYGMEVDTLELAKDLKTQTAQLIETARQKPAAVLMLTGPEPVSGRGLAALHKAGVPLITIGQRLEGAHPVSHIGPDNLAGGRLAGKMVVQALSGKGKVVELIGKPDSDLSHDLGMGFAVTLTHHPEVELVAREVADFNAAEAEKAVTRLLKRGVGFDALFAHNEAMVLGAWRALDKARHSGLLKTSPALIGYGHLTGRLITKTNGELAGTVDNNMESLGKLALIRAAEWLRGEDIPSEELSAPKPEVR